MGTPELGLGAGLRLGKWIRASARLYIFGRPFIGIVTVNIQAFASRCNRNGEAIIIADHTLGYHVIIFAALLVDFTAAHDTWILVRTLPRPIRISKAHLQNEPIAVNVLFVQPIAFILVGIRTRT